MREHHESDSEDVEDDVMEDVARQYFISSILVHFSPCRATSLIMYVTCRAVEFCPRVP